MLLVCVWFAFGLLLVYFWFEFGFLLDRFYIAFGLLLIYFWSIIGLLLICFCFDFALFLFLKIMFLPVTGAMAFALQLETKMKWKWNEKGIRRELKNYELQIFIQQQHIEDIFHNSPSYSYFFASVETTFSLSGNVVFLKKWKKMKTRLRMK